MIILDVEQGSPEWFSARLGIPTASMFDKIITTTGQPSKSAANYAFAVAGERLSGRVEEGYTNAAMERGKELESEARELYEFVSGCEVKQIGLVYKDENRLFSCSPDGLIGNDGGVEIKCPSIGVHTRYLYGNKCPTDYYQQVQGCLFVTGRKWWDFVSYYPDVEPLIVRCYPDRKFQDALSREIEKFCSEVDRIVSEISRRIMEG
jgi:putative phage-type endonuclease